MGKILVCDDEEQLCRGLSRLLRGDGHEVATADGPGGAAMLSVLALLAQVADTHCTVLVTGQSGTGKELAARSLHAGSSRAKRPFVAVNCAAIPVNLVESELFGHSRGAFTGATTTRQGRFGQADTGTIFLDEIGEMDLNVQAKVLRLIQKAELPPAGEAAV